MEGIGYRQNQRAHVTRLRVRASGIDPLRTRLRIVALLNNTRAQPTGLSPAAIVFVRELSDPLPGSLPLNSHQLNPPVAWQRALTLALDQTLTNAARPGLAVVPAAANSVVFSDRSELLACLASDWCEARIATQWWWQSLLKQGDAGQVVWKAWQDSPEYVPAALQHLARWGKAVEFISALSDERAYEVIHAVAGSFGLSGLIPPLDYAPVSERSQFETNEARVLTSSTRLVQYAASEVFVAGQPPAPWQSAVPEGSASGLGVGQQLLLGIGLLLRRAPAKVRSSGFAREVACWRREIAQMPVIGLTSDQQSDDEDRSRRSAAFHQSGGISTEDLAVNHSPFSINEQNLARHSVSSCQNQVTAPHAQALLSPQPTDYSARDVSPPEIEEGFASSAETLPEPLTRAESRLQESSAAGPEELNLDRVSQAAFETATSDPSLIEASAETQYGGVLYLINLALSLGLYGDFSTPAEPGIELDIWDFVALVGRELAGEEIESDPLWPLLALLAGRENDGALGAGFTPEDEWRMPPDWLEPFSDGSLSCTTRDGRLLVFHSDGFLVIDVPLRMNGAPTQLHRELKAFHDFKFPVAPLPAGEDPFSEKGFKSLYSKPNGSFAIKVWLSRLMPYVRARLRKALGLADTEDPSAVVCRHSARVLVTPTHVDVFLTLAELPIELRRAGLDRNPGWVPAAGRFIEIHFE